VGKYTGHRVDQCEKSSDFDFAIVDGALFNKAIHSGVDIASAGTLTDQLKARDIERLGLGHRCSAVGKQIPTRRENAILLQQNIRDFL
jgi:hypothetical protein